MENLKNNIFKIIRFLHAFGKHIISGNVDVDNLTYRKRLKTCFSCDELDTKKTPTCKVCGCKVLLKAKWKEQNCPREKW